VVTNDHTTLRLREEKGKNALYMRASATQGNSPTPTCRSGETSQDDSLYNAFVACPTFRGKDNNISLLQLFRDCMHGLYIRLFDIDVEAIAAPEDFYTTISDATKAAGYGHTTYLDPHHLLYLFEFLRTVKIGGSNSPYVCIEWPGIQIS